MLTAMEAEWNKWQEFKSTKPLTQAVLDKLLRDHPEVRIIDTRWVLTRKPDGSMKARLVVIGCQEVNTLRHDAPTGSALAFMLLII